MKKRVLLIPILLLTLSLWGQKNLPKFGEIDSLDFTLKACPFEQEANAMKIFDIQEMEYEPSAFEGKIRTEKRVRIKIFNEKGFANATIYIPYYSNKKNTKIEELKGVIYNKDISGKITVEKLEEADFFTEKAMEKVGVLRFTFPNLKPGSVIEYSYLMTEKNRLYFDPWIIQSVIPVAYTSISLTIPTFAGLKEIIFGSDSVSRRKEVLTKGLDREKRTFFKENVVSFKPEPFMTSYNDNVLRMGFLFFPQDNLLLNNYSPASMWKVAANMLVKSTFFEDQWKKEIQGTQKIIDTASTILYVPDRIRYLFNSVKKRMPERTGQAGVAGDIQEAWKNRSGTSAQINMILMNFLHRSNIKCYPVLISTRENGKINTEFPNFGQFNGMDVLVVDNGFNYLMDASLKFQSFDTPPLNVLNRQAFLLDPDNIRWIKISDDRPLLKQSTDIFGTLTTEGVLEGSASVNYYDYAKAFALDTSIKENDNKEGKFFDKSIPGLKILSDKQENAELDEALVHTIEFDYDCSGSGDFYFINPQLFSSKKANPFTSEKRNTDIDFGCNQEFRLKMQLNIPPSFIVEHLPKNIVVRSADSSFIYTRIVTASSSNISFSQLLEIKQALFDKTEYAGLYEFFNSIGSLMKEEIIIKKKK